MTLLPDFNELSSLRAAAGRRGAAALRLQTNSAITGTFHASSRGQGLEFEEVRLYAPGDDIRAIDWRVTARTGHAYTKLFREERDRSVFLCVDMCIDMQFGTRNTFKSVQAAKAAALLGWRALAAKDRVGFCMFGTADSDGLHIVTPSCSKRRFGGGLQTLCRSDTIGDTSISVTEMLTRAGSRMPHGSICYIISDFSRPGEKLASQIAFLRKKHSLFAIAVDDPADYSLPKKSFRCRGLDDVLMRVSPYKAGRDAYTQQWKTTRDMVTHAFGTHFISLKTTDIVESVL